MNADFRGKRATVMGLGHFGGGVAAARWLARQGAVVTVTDEADQSSLADALPRMADVPIAAMHLGGHRPEDFADAELVVVNPAVRPTSPWLDSARKFGARLTTEIGLFIENCPARIIGVTGSNGKSTTAAMIASILRAAGRRTFLGGNIGGSLIEQLGEIRPEDWVVLELSSFQLWHSAPDARMPHVAVVTGCSPNHLDWHGSMAEYVAAKQRILTGQTPDDFAVLSPFDREVASWSTLIRGRQTLLEKGDRRHSCAAPSGPFRQMAPVPFFVPDLRVPGEHNRINATLAAAAAMAVDCPCEAVRAGLEQFSGLPQRLEWFAVVDGRRFYNDSTATTPESTVAALRSLDMPIWLLAGGKSKGFDFCPLATEIARRAAGAAYFGASRDELLAKTTAQNTHLSTVAVETMDEALRWCWQRSKPGDAILLSPACASTDQFRNFRHRGERFVELVRMLASTH